MAHTPSALHPRAVLASAHPEARRHRAPAPRTGLVTRRPLISRIEADRDASLVLVSAPAGYGKTTLLAQWAAQTARPVLWLDVYQAHNDPVALMLELIETLEDLEPLADPELARSTEDSPSALSTRAIPRLGRCVRAIETPFVLVLDDAGWLTDRACLEMIRVVADAVPAGSRLALSCRDHPALRLAAIRASRRLIELGPRDLSMGPAEAALLLEGMGVHVDAEQMGQLMSRTEGWPAGLVLAGLLIRTHEDPGEAIRHLTGDDRRIADYFVEEVLQAAASSQVDLLLGTSVLDVLTADAASAVLEAPVTAYDLQDLERTNRFITPVDERGEAFRHHPLFAEMLRAELRRRTPERWRALHRRAATWCAESGDPLAAVRHLIAAGDDADAAALVWRSVPTREMTGRMGTVRRMVAAFPPEEVGHRAPLAMAKAWTCLDTAGDTVEAWIRAGLAAAEADGIPGEPSEFSAAAATLRAVVCETGVARMAADAETGLAGDGDWGALACTMCGIAADLRADDDEAARLLREGSTRAAGMLPSVYALSEGWRGVAAVRAHDWAAVATHTARGRRQMDTAGLRDQAPAAILDALTSLLSARAEDHEASRAHRHRCQGILTRYEDVMPWLGLTSRVLLARAAILTGDAEAARTLMAEAAAHHARVPDSPVMDAMYAECREALGGLTPDTLTGAATLTTAEVRVLHFLPTHLTFREIGERVHLSRFTIKTQALSVYRKLGVTSRSEAVAHARALGLLDDT